MIFLGWLILHLEKTGLSADIWSDHKGIERQVSHSNIPRIKITTKKMVLHHLQLNQIL